MAVKYQPSELRVRSYILKDLTNKERLFLQSILDRLNLNSTMTTLSLESDNILNNYVKLRAYAEDGSLISEETFFNGIYSVLKKALKRSTADSATNKRLHARTSL